MVKISGSPEYTASAIEQSERRHVARAMLTSDDQDGHGEQPSGPRHDCRMGPTEPSHERATELVDGSGCRASNHPESKDACERICARPAITKVTTICAV